MTRFGVRRYRSPRGLEVWFPGFYWASGKRVFLPGSYRVVRVGRRVWLGKDTLGSGS